MKLTRISIIFIILILVVPVFGIPTPRSFGTNINSLDRLKGLVSAVDINSLGNSYFPVVSINGRDFIDLGHGFLYPLDNININISIKSDLGSLRILPPELWYVKIPIIIKYDGLMDRDALLKFIPEIGGSIENVYKAFPLISAKVPIENVSKIYFNSFSVDLMVDYKVHIRLNESVPMIKPPEEWSSLETNWGTEINGSGIVIGILDTGIYEEHPDFYFPNGTSKIIYSVSFVPGEDPADGFGHGTHVAGIAAGTGRASNGRFRGVAPGAMLANIKVLANNGSGYVSWIIKGVEYAINQSIDVINLSLGGGNNGIGDDPLSIAVDKAVEEGVVVVVAAGNDGPYYFSLGTPAVSHLAITVGAIDKNWSIAVFSSRGPTGDLRVKPDVLAPGVGIIAPLAKDSYLEKVLAKRYPGDVVKGDGGDYIKLDGTSMASPHVAGVAALILQAHKDYTPKMVRSAIISTSTPLGYDMFTEGLGVVNAYRAVSTSVLPSNPLQYIGNYLESNKTLVYRLKSVDGESHSINIVEKNIGLFYNYNVTVDFESFISVTTPSTVPSVGYADIVLSIDALPYRDIYYGSITVSIDNNYNITLGFSVFNLPKLVVNVTLDGAYLDAYFAMYRHSDPDNIILPSGFRYSLEGEFNYSAWFYLTPGNYTLFALGLNISEADEFIHGPMYIATKEVVISKYTDMYFLKLEASQGVKTTLPLVNKAGNEIEPFFTIVSFLTSSNKTMVFYLGGLWNRTSTDIYFSLDSGDNLYLNTQFFEIPPYPCNITEALKYAYNFFSISWLLNSTPEELVLPHYYGYTIDSRGLIDGEIGYMGLAVFPPYQEYTYLALTPFYQGGTYMLYVTALKNKEYVGFLTLDPDASGYRSISYVDPETDDSRLIRPVNPPYVPFMYITKGVDLSGTYLNITSALLTSYAPLDVIFEGNSTLEVYHDGNLTKRVVETDSFNFERISFLPIQLGKYTVIGKYRLSYPLYNFVNVTAVFNPKYNDPTPPIPYEFVIPPVIEGNETLYLVFLDKSSLDVVNVSISWDNGFSWIENEVDVWKGSLGLYKKYTLKIPISPHPEALLSIKIHASDSYGNYINITMYNVSRTYVMEGISPEIYFKPRIVAPNQSISLYIDEARNTTYGIPINIDGKFMFNIPVNKSMAFNLTGIPLFNSLGMHNVSGVIDVNSLREPVSIEASVLVTYLVLSKVEASYGGKPFNEVGDNTSIRVSVGDDVHLRYHVIWAHNSSPALNAVIKVDDSEAIVSTDGYAEQVVSRDVVGEMTLVVSGVSFTDPIFNTSLNMYSSNISSISIIWDMIMFEVVEPTSGSRYPINTEVTIVVKGWYAYDNTSFNGVVEMNGQEKSAEDGILNFIVSEGSVGLFNYTVSNVVDDLYGITKYTPVSISLIFDKVGLDANITYIEEKDIFKVDISTFFIYDESPVYDAVVFVNGSTANVTSPGRYSAVLPSKGGSQVIEVTVEFNDYPKVSRQFNVEAPEKISFPIELIGLLVGVVAVILIFVVIRRIKR